MKKKIICTVLFLAVVIGTNLFLLKCNIEKNYSGTFHVELKADTDNEIQMFYSKDGNFTENNSKKKKISAQNNASLAFDFYSDTALFRLDMGDKPDKLVIYSMYAELCGEKIDIDVYDVLKNAQISGITDITRDGDGVAVVTENNDPFVVIKADTFMSSDIVKDRQKRDVMIIRIIAMIAVDLVFLLCFRFRRDVFDFIKEMILSKKLVYNLAKNDFKTKYAGSYLGIIWAFIQPIVTILVYWFVFSVGFRSGTISDFPFVLWLMCGMIPWFFFSESWNAATNALIEYSYLVKKVVFKINILPVVKLVSALFVHIFFVFILLVAFMLYGFFPDMYAIQVIYYSIGLAFFALGLSYITCSIVVFFKDLGQIISILLQVGMWMTPIMWNYEMVPERFQWILKINPIYYVVQGYRNSLIEKVWFWHDGLYTVYFWGISLFVFLVGTKMFNRLKVHFADVL